jgi:hypothetical protein
VQALAQIYKIKDIFLEARTTEANRGTKEFIADTRIKPDSVGDLVDVSTSGFANSRKGVNGGDTLGEHGIGSELGELR